MLAKLARPTNSPTTSAALTDRARDRQAVDQQIILRRRFRGLADHHHADVGDDANGLNGLADGRVPKRNPARPCPGRTRCPAFGRRVENQLPIAGRLAVSDRSLTLAPMWMSPKSSVVSPSRCSRSDSGASGDLLGDAELLIHAPIDLDLGNRADAEADAERRHGEQVAAQSGHRQVDIALVVNAGFDQDAAGADRFGIFGLSGRCCAKAGAARTRAATKARTNRRIIGSKRFSAVEKNGYGSVVDERHLHHRLKLAGRDAKPTGRQFSHDIFVERFRNLRRRRRGKRRPPSVARIAGERELRHDQHAALSMSSTDRFILPASSGKIRRSRILDAMYCTSAGPSPCSTPTARAGRRRSRR